MEKFWYFFSILLINFGFRYTDKQLAVWPRRVLYYAQNEISADFERLGQDGAACHFRLDQSWSRRNRHFLPCSTRPRMERVENYQERKFWRIGSRFFCIYHFNLCIKNPHEFYIPYSIKIFIRNRSKQKSYFHKNPYSAFFQNCVAVKFFFKATSAKMVQNKRRSIFKYTGGDYKTSQGALYNTKHSFIWARHGPLYHPALKNFAYF